MVDQSFSSPINIGLDDTPDPGLEFNTYQQFQAVFNAIRILQDKLGTYAGTGPLDPNNFINNYTTFADSIQVQRLQAIVVLASAAINSGDFVNLFSSGGLLKSRQANASALATRAWGWAPQSIGAGNAGIIYLLSGYTPGSGLTLGSTYYLSSSTPGGITTTAPSVAGTIKQEVGLALSATDFLVRLSTPIVN